MYKKIFAALPLPLEGKILGISGMKYWIGSRNYTPPEKVISDDANLVEAEYPEINVLSLPYKNGSFDYVICDQVLEHIEGNMEIAVSEIRRVLKPGGMAVFASPFIYPIHFGPKDLWRISTDGWKYLTKDFSETIACDSWGNRLFLGLMFLYPKIGNWQIPDNKYSFKNYLATKNNIEYPLITWTIVKK